MYGQGFGFVGGPPGGQSPPNAGYPPQSGYPSAPGFSIPGYPPQQPGYPTQQPGYPPQQPGYPPQQPGYPSQPSGYPPQPSGYPSQPSDYSPPLGYPSQQAGMYPAMQQTGGYPPQQPTAYPNPQGGYPQYPNAPGSFPPPQAAPSNPYYSPQQSHGESPAKPEPPVQTVGSTLASGPSNAKMPKVEGTVKPYSPFDKEQDAKDLRAAMKGLGTNEDEIIRIICKRTNEQRQQIKLSFKQCFGRDLIKDLKSELSGNFERVILACMMPSDEFDADSLRKAVKGLGTNDSALIEIMCSRTSEEILAAKKAYTTLFKRDLESDIRGDTSGDYGRLMNQMQNGCRDPDSTPVDLAKAKADAEAIYQAGEKRWGTDEETFRRVFAIRSWPQLAAMFDVYHKTYHKDIESVIKGELSSNFERAMRVIAQCARNRPDYFAVRFHESMVGLGTDDETLIRLVVSRSEKDLVQVKQCFQQRYHKTLEQWIEDDTSGDYRKALLTLVRGH